MAKPREQITKGAARVGALAVGTGSRAGTTFLYRLKKGTLSISPAQLISVTKQTVTVALTGLALTDFLILHPPQALATGYIYNGHKVLADAIEVYFQNWSSATVASQTLTWDYLWFDMTA